MLKEIKSFIPTDKEHKLGNFNISGDTNSTITPIFNYTVSLDKTKQNYIDTTNRAK